MEKRTVFVEQVLYDGINAHQWLDEKGNPRFQSLLVQEIKKENIQMDTQPQGAVSSSEGEPLDWEILVKRFLITGSHFYFADNRPGILANHDLGEINTSIENLTFTPDKAILNEKVKVAVTGEMILVPFSAILDYQVQELELARFSIMLKHLQRCAGRRRPQSERENPYVNGRRRTYAA